LVYRIGREGDGEQKVGRRNVEEIRDAKEGKKDECKRERNKKTRKGREREIKNFDNYAALIYLFFSDGSKLVWKFFTSYSSRGGIGKEGERVYVRRRGRSRREEQARRLVEARV
jgi:hypothetical protein